MVCAALHQGRLESDRRFVILCSGYRTEGDRSGGYIKVPSLHIFGDRDKQVPLDRSEDLADAFDPETRSIIRHDMGHVIPSSRTYVEDYLRWLRLNVVVAEPNTI